MIIMSSVMAGPIRQTMAGAEPWQEGKDIVLVQTGTTALTRAMIPAIDRSGDPVSSIKYTRAITRQADIAVASNEVSFWIPAPTRSGTA